jgi:hypothetical protein
MNVSIFLRKITTWLSMQGEPCIGYFFPSMAEKQSNEKVREVMIWLRCSYDFMMLVEISLPVSLLKKLDCPYLLQFHPVEISLPVSLLKKWLV